MFAGLIIISKTIIRLHLFPSIAGFLHENKYDDKYSVYSNGDDFIFGIYAY